MLWKIPLTVALAVAGAGLLAAAPAASATDACDGEPLVWTPLLSAGAFTGECAGAFVVLHHDGCMMVEWGVHDAPVGVGGANTCTAGVWTSGHDVPVPPVLP